jgi:hypothetical protein
MAVAFRKSATFEVNEKALAAWLRMGERKAERMPCAPYDEERFRSALIEARRLTRDVPSSFVSELVELCSAAGVAVVFVPELSGCRANGATRWVSPTRALLQLSLRYKTDDQLWFTFFHEAGHILLHKKRAIFLEGNGSVGREEEEANAFAADFLIPQSEFTDFADLGSPSEVEIREFAAGIGVSPGIVVGRLHHEGLLPYTHHSSLKLKLEWAGDSIQGVGGGRADT